MKLKQYLTLGLGIAVGFGVSIAGLSYAAQNGNDKISLITSEKAKSIMMDKVPGATILEFSYDGDDKVTKYDGTLIKDNYEYEIDVNANTGEIIKFEKEKIVVLNDSNSKNQVSNTESSYGQSNTQANTNVSIVTNSYIGEAKAKSIMLSKVPGSTIKSLYLDNDNTPKYEGKLIKDNTEYEISVNAKTGKIIEFSQDMIDTYDDKYDADDKYDVDDKYDTDDKYDVDDKYDTDDKYDIDDKYDDDDKYDTDDKYDY